MTLPGAWDSAGWVVEIDGAYTAVIRSAGFAQAHLGIDKWRRACPAPPGGSTLGAGLFCLAKHAFLLGDWSRAAPLVREAWHADGETAATLGLFGHIRFAAGDLDAAAMALAGAVALEPEATILWRSAGSVAYAQGYLSAAIRFYRQAVTLDPGFVEVRRNLARALQAGGRLIEAADTFREVVARSPGQAEPLRNLANVLFSLGDHDAAGEAFEAALALDPSLDSARRSLGDLRLSQGRTAEAEEQYGQIRNENLATIAALGLAECRRLLGGDAQPPAIAEAAARQLARARRLSAVPSGIRVLEPQNFREFFAGIGSSVDRCADLLAYPALREMGVSDTQRVSADDDRAFHDGGLSLAHCRDLTVSYSASRNTSTPLGAENYLATKVYERPGNDPRSLCFYPRQDIGWAMPYWAYDTTDLPSVTVEHPCVYLGGTPNYGHFMIDIVPKLRVLDCFGRGGELPIYLHALTAGHREMLASLAPGRRFVDLSTLGDGREFLVRFRDVLVPSNSAYSSTVHWLRARVSDQEPTLFDRDRHRRAYLSRLNYFPERHRVANELEIIRALARRGFEIIPIEQLSFMDTARLFAGMATIISSGGAQSVCVAFGSGDARYIELCPANIGDGNKSWFNNDCLGAYA